MTTEWDRHVAVEQVSATDDEQEYAADLTAGWSVGGGINGGYQLAVVGAALSRVLPGKPDPLAVSAHYVGPGIPGPATVRVRTLKDGGRVGTLAADLVQEGRTRLTALATCGHLAGLPDDVRTTAEEWRMPPPEECVPNTFAPDELRRIAPLMDRFDMHFDPGHVGWTVGQPSGNGVLQAWFRLKDGRQPDPVSLLMVVDALPPVTFDLGMPGWAPTLELTAHVRAVPAPGWLKVRHLTRNVAGGMFEEDCEVWDSAGRLVAQSRQLAMQPLPQG